MTNTRELSWGLRMEVEVRAAWGGRLIAEEVTAGGHGIVGNRQDAIGEDADRAAFLERLNGGVMAAAMDRFRELRSFGRLRGNSRESAVLYERDGIVVEASTNASYGYLYVTAYEQVREEAV